MLEATKAEKVQIYSTLRLQILERQGRSFALKVKLQKEVQQEHWENEAGTDLHQKSYYSPYSTTSTRSWDLYFFVLENEKVQHTLHSLYTRVYIAVSEPIEPKGESCVWRFQMREESDD